MKDTTQRNLRYAGAALLTAVSAYLVSDKVKTAVDENAKKARDKTETAWEKLKRRFR